MAKPKQRAAKRSPKAARSTAKAARAKPVKKPVAKAARKAPAKAAHKIAKTTPKKAAKAAPKKARAVKPAKPARPAVRKVAKASHPTKPAATRKAAPAHGHAGKHETRNHSAPVQHAHHAPAHAPVRKPAHVRPAGGVAARLKVSGGADEQTITREDGRYALPSSVNIDLPKGYHPNGKEEYMGPRQLAYFRQKLKDWRDQLVEESRQTMENLREEVRDVGDDAERATRETENSLELRTRDRYRKLISKIEKALRKIEEGRYGYCEETDEEIGLERLEARPIATLSLDAQERREHLQKQMGD
jgi:DnaK suppressor protein